MKNVDIIKDAAKNTGRSKVRTGLTVTAIVIGAFTLTLTNSVGTGISSYIDNQVGSLGNADVISVFKPAEEAKSEGPTKYEMKTPGSSQDNSTAMGLGIELLTESDIEKLEKLSNVQFVSPTIMANPDYIQGQNGEKFVFSPNPAVSVMTPDLKAGSGFTEEGSEKVSREIIIPTSYVNALGYSSDEEIINKKVTIGVTDYALEQHNVEATVVGVQNKSLFGESVSLSEPLTKELSEIQKTGLPEIENSYVSAIVTMTPDLSEDGITQLKQNISDLGLKGQTIKDQLGTMQSVINGLIGVLNAFAVITLIAASFGIMNTLLMSVKERTREIGLMKAMGMPSSKIFSLFSLEAIIIGFLGSAIGVAGAMVVGTVASNILSTTILSDLEGLTISLFTFPDIATVILIVMGIAFLSGTIPAASAAKQNPIDALHYE